MRTFLKTMVGVISLCGTANTQEADTVYTGGKIYTVNEKQPWAEAVDQTKCEAHEETQLVDRCGVMVNVREGMDGRRSRFHRPDRPIIPSGIGRSRVITQQRKPACRLHGLAGIPW